MELSQKRKEELAEGIFTSRGVTDGGSLNISKDRFLNTNEENFVKEKLMKYGNVFDSEKTIYVKDLDVMLKNARTANPELNTEMNKSIKTELSFSDRHEKFFGISAVLTTPVLLTSLALNTATAPHAFEMACAMAGLSTLTSTLALRGASSTDIPKKMQVELKTLLNHEFGLSNEKNFEVKNNAESVLEKMRNLGDKKADKKFSF